MRARRIVASALGLIALVALWSSLYIHIVFDGRLTIESLVEGLNFSVQTVTTVGYGNWEPVGLEAWKRLWLKALSIPLMVVGALFFALLVSELVEPRRKAT
jgi:Trk-type K+ transport system membrane component